MFTRDLAKKLKRFAEIYPAVQTLVPIIFTALIIFGQSFDMFGMCHGAPGVHSRPPKLAVCCPACNHHFNAYTHLVEPPRGCGPRASYFIYGTFSALLGCMSFAMSRNPAPAAPESFVIGVRTIGASSLATAAFCFWKACRLPPDHEDEPHRHVRQTTGDSSQE